MDFDQDLADVLATSVKNLDPPVALIVAESARLGRRHQRARRLRALRVGGTSLAVTAVLGAALATSQLRDRSAPVPPPPAGPAATAASPTASPSPSEPSPSALSADAQLTPDAMVKLLSDRLPAGGSFVKYQQPYADHPLSEALGAYLRYDDGRGTATFELAMYRGVHPFPGGDRAPGVQDTPFNCDSIPLRPSGPPPGPISCRTRFLADGSWEMVSVTDGGEPSLYRYEVTIWRPDSGDILRFAEYAGTIDASKHEGTVTRAEPPVPLAQWQAIAESPDWQFRVPRTLVDEGARLASGIPHAPFPEG
ncbi:hypothetical protein AB0O31_21090 [Kitasatospora cineracea]|uniref:hypothetical protein n=1 Tax=Kitasatospora cineracea TaxID=88074 RepID=UPI00344A9432